MYFLSMCGLDGKAYQGHGTRTYNFVFSTPHFLKSTSDVVGGWHHRTERLKGKVDREFGRFNAATGVCTGQPVTRELLRDEHFAVIISVGRDRILSS